MNRRKIKPTIINLFVFSVSLLTALLIFEIASRYVFPVSLGAKALALDGTPIKVHNEYGRHIPGISYRQISDEYDVITTITPQGYRVPIIHENPDVIFIGDSFTFGTGLPDKDTFVYLYASEQGLSCVNLGHPGTGTMQQLDILEDFIETQKWRPKQVKLFMVIMSNAFFVGNDFIDNLLYSEAIKEKKEIVLSERPVSAFGNILLTMKYRLLQYSNLARIVKFHIGPQLGTLFVPEMHKNIHKKAVKVTRSQLLRLDKLSHSYGFSYEIFLIHPIPDLVRGSYKQTFQTLRQIAPSSASVYSTAFLFQKEPKNYYYPLDVI